MSLAQIGGVPAVLKFLLQEGFIDGSCLTVTGATNTLLLTRHHTSHYPWACSQLQKVAPTSQWCGAVGWDAPRM